MRRINEALRYESPCGVMRASSVADGIHAVRYESPCGVMSSSIADEQSVLGGLRIPMRGYESDLQVRCNFAVIVTNPHAGL